ncbi:MAG: excinuclease ABC subunit UvrA [Candidatus Niyogibacteria bacterium]|nr:excinuclease ABC subunit UvrA [Candidatus Niyogibacteria bacterium]
MARKNNPKDFIHIQGARVHNLKNISLSIPKNKLVVFTGLSGSGKSSLAFDTIYAEAERRFVESLSSYARQFLGVREKPDVDKITGLSPTIAIDQRLVSRNPRSTVGTMTEIHDYLRVLFARFGSLHCPRCRGAVKRQGIEDMVSRIRRAPLNPRVAGAPSAHLTGRANFGRYLMILAPMVVAKRGEHKKALFSIQKQGFLRVRLDGGIMRVEEAIDLELDPAKKHSLEVVIDRLIIDKHTERGRLLESLGAALKVGNGRVTALFSKNEFDDAADEDNIQELVFSENFSCVKCGVSLPEIEPRLFSFNSPHGACRSCTGLGNRLEVEPELVIPNKDLSLAEGAIRPWSRFAYGAAKKSWHWWMLEHLAEKHKFSLTVPVKTLSPKIINLILRGEQDLAGADEAKPSDKYEGVIPNLEKRWKEADSDWARGELEQYMRSCVCLDCQGLRLHAEALAVTIPAGGKKYDIAQISDMPAENALIFFEGLMREQSKNKAVTSLLKEIIKRSQFLLGVGLGYISLGRSADTLSGGEAQRVRLATQIGLGLSNVIYVLDEPSVGLHPADHSKLITTLKELRDADNSVFVVEHDLETIKEADWVVDIGPGAGKHGGQVLFEGTYEELRRAPTLTGHYLSGKKRIKINKRSIDKKSPKLTIRGASEHNLKNINVEIPLGKLVCVSGVSGSGKSTLVNDILARALRRHFNGSREVPGKHKSISGLDAIDKMVIMDQSPIGKTPRSNPATYTGAFSFIRDLFAGTRDATARKYKAGDFSFNVKGGRCEACEGQGVKNIDMYFLPDIFVECEECRGARYKAEVLRIIYNGLNIAEVLDMSSADALPFFKDSPQIVARLQTLVDVGLGYMKLGQAATTLSGGEAQRVKLADELAKKETGKTLYILDEPTTGLHSDDIQKLLTVLSALVDKGNSVLIVEHNLDVLRNADWIIDMGPEGGELGGEVVGEGVLPDIIKNKKSQTGRWLQKY